MRTGRRHFQHHRPFHAPGRHASWQRHVLQRDMTHGGAPPGLGRHVVPQLVPQQFEGVLEGEGVMVRDQADLQLGRVVCVRMTAAADVGVKGSLEVSEVEGVRAVVLVVGGEGGGDVVVNVVDEGEDVVGGEFDSGGGAGRTGGADGRSGVADGEDFAL